MDLPGGYRFRPHERLHNGREYRRVFRRGEKALGRAFVCYIAPSQATECSRLGLTVSRKVGGAVTRNRVKRSLREFFRRHKHAFARPVDLVVVARRAAAALDAKETALAMQRLLEETGLLRD